MTIGAVVHAVVDQEASTPQFKQDGRRPETNKNNEAKEKKRKILKISYMSKLASASSVIYSADSLTKESSPPWGIADGMDTSRVACM